MKRITMTSLAVVPLLLFSSQTVAAQTPQTAEAQHAIQWLHTKQRPSGQVGEGGNPIARSSETAISLAAASQDAATFDNGTGGASLADFLKTAVPTDVGTNGLLLMARVVQPRAGPTAGPIGQLQSAYLAGCSTARGEYGDNIFSDGLAILGLRAAGQKLGTEAVAFLRSKANPTDHGWSFDNKGEFGSDSNSTALVIQALLAAGMSTGDAVITGGFAFLKTQFVGGGFTFQLGPGSVPDANSAELVIQAIVAAGLQQDPTWSPMLQSTLSNLASLQFPSGQPDSGALKGFDGKASLLATTLAPAAFLLRPLTTRSDQAVGVAPACATPSAAATPAVTPATTPAASVAPARLPQTGSPPWLAILLLAGGILTSSLGFMLRLHSR